MAILDATVPVQHRVFIPNVASTGRHGSAAEGELSDPVQRFAYQVYPAHQGGTVTFDPVNIETAARVITDLFMDVDDPSVYKKHDEVQINGIAYVVQGLPVADNQWGDGTQLFSEYDDMFGGLVHIRRVS